MGTTRQCEECGNPFFLTRSQALNTAYPRLYCTSECRQMAQARQSPPCGACGDIRLGNLAPQYGLLLCRPCTKAAYLSCWRKVQHANAFTAECAVTDDEATTSYQCGLCSRWHATRRVSDPPPDWVQRLALIAVHMREVGFDINGARGWAKSSRSTHNLT